jgi:hypothetical protein
VHAHIKGLLESFADTPLVKTSHMARAGQNGRLKASTVLIP